MDYVKCSQKRTDCMLYACDMCLALADTFFDKTCPFFKKAEHDTNILVFLEGIPGVWRWIDGVGGNYLVSDQGSIINHHKRLLTPIIDSKGYPVVRLQFLQNYINIRVDELVLRAFQPYESGRIIHIDGDKTNCALENLKRSE